MTGRRVTKQAQPVFGLHEQGQIADERSTLDIRADDAGLVEVINNQRGREQSMGWGVYRGGKIYVVGTTRQHALLNLAQGRKVLNVPDQ